MELKKKKTLNCRGRLIDLSRPKVMGVLNLTPDSFYDGGRHNTIHAALQKTALMLTEGADIVDIGAYSSRPGAEHISPVEETERLLPVLKALLKEFPGIIVSVDTFRAEVAAAAIADGAHIINDISAGGMDPGMFAIIAEQQVPYIMMHMKGTPQNMVKQASYKHLITDVLDYFISRIRQLTDMGARDLIIDPGFGFAKTMDHSYELLAALDQFKITGLPLLAGVSRKSMIYKLLGTTAEEALNGTTVVNTIALMKGADLLRVHDVKAAAEAVKITEKLHALQQTADKLSQAGLNTDINS